MRRIASLFLAFAIVITSCKKQETAAYVVQSQPPGTTDALRTLQPLARKAANAETNAGAQGGAVGGVVGGVVAADAPSSTTPAAAPVQKLPRMIIRTADVHVVVRDTAAAVNTLTNLAQRSGGYVGDSKTWRDGEQLRATITLRVPASGLADVLAEVRKLAVRIDGENISANDVSQEYVDLSSQLKNGEAAENDLRELMSEVRQKTKRAADVLEMYEQLKVVRGEVEQTRGRMQYLSQLSAMTTINVELIPDAVARPVVEPGWQPLVVAKDAGRSLVRALQAVATAVIWLALYVLPMVLLFVLPVLLLAVLVRRLRRTPATS